MHILLPVSCLLDSTIFSKTNSWWRHQMETFSSLLAICAGNSPVTGQSPVTRSFDVFFDLRLNKRLSKQSWGWWLETPSRPLWCHCNVIADFPSTVAIMNFNVYRYELNACIIWMRHPLFMMLHTINIAPVPLNIFRSIPQHTVKKIRTTFNVFKEVSDEVMVFGLACKKIHGVIFSASADI